ncbi:MAG: alpha/beta hydrolase [Planctomycetes bacterium]|nr:alpha/beta hydrolase [Planctomycetota bacterium]
MSDCDIVYNNVEGQELMLDIARPAKGGPFPTVMFIFGGGFTRGSRKDWYAQVVDAAQRGYVGVAVDHRLTSVRGDSGRPKYPFPAQIYDVKCAVRWLRANAGKYAIDVDHIGIVGYSSGGMLSLLLALTDVNDGLEGACLENYSSSVQAAVNIAGPVDLVMNYQFYPSYMELLLGGSPVQVPDRYTAASPITYIGGENAPILSLCGSEDPMLFQLKLLDDQMKAVGSTHTLIVIQGIGHYNLFALDYSQQDSPGWKFLDACLK